MSKACAVCLVTLLAACGAPQEPAPPKSESKAAKRTDHAAIKDGEMTVYSNGGFCEVEVRSGGAGTRFPLAINGPCALMRDYRGEAQTFHYADSGSLDVFLVAGEIEGKCGPVAQGVLVRPGEAKASPLILRGSYKCPESGLDERDYWIAGHP